MIKRSFSFPSVVGDCDIAAVDYLPENGKIRGVVQIIHGMLEHIDRYDSFAAQFAAQGYAVYGHSHLGHGHSVNERYPRGYFGTTEFIGDPAYDWVKVYYSLVGNYDQFNLKRFHLEIGEKDVRLEIASNHWEEMEDEFFDLLSGDVTREQMRLLLAIIWLSLTTYAWEDYDSICGAFYNGLLYLEDAL